MQLATLETTSRILTRTPPVSAPPEDSIDDYLAECRALVLDEIRTLARRGRGAGGRLYGWALERAPLGGTGLPAALAVASCRALGGHLESVLRTAVVLELHDGASLAHGGALTLEPLLDNITRIGLGRALRTLRLVARMTRESAAGRMTELEWTRRAPWTPTERDYLRAVHQKTTWPTFLAPLLAGGLAAGAGEEWLRALTRFATPLGVAFQIEDDLGNLAGDEGQGAGGRGEERHGFVRIHALRACAGRSGAIEAARAAARRRAERARRSFAASARALPPSRHRDFLAALVDLAVEGRGHRLLVRRAPGAAEAGAPDVPGPLALLR